jgi:ribosome-associated heat shock protein Hsp15
VTAVRLDKWLWHARLAKTRALAQKFVAKGHVTVNGALAHKYGAPIRPGDRVAVVLGPVRRTLIVRDIGERRGPAAEARMLYDEPNPPERLSWEEAALPLHAPVKPAQNTSP